MTFSTDRRRPNLPGGHEGEGEEARSLVFCLQAVIFLFISLDRCMELHALEERRGGAILLVQVVGGAVWRLPNRCLALCAGEIVEPSFVTV